MSGVPRTSDRPRASTISGPRVATPATLSYHEDSSEDTLVSAITRTCTCSSCARLSEDLEARQDEGDSRSGPSSPRGRPPSEPFERDSINEGNLYSLGETIRLTTASGSGRGEAAASSTFRRHRSSDSVVLAPVYYEPPNVRDARFEANILRQIGFATPRQRPNIAQEAGRRSSSGASIDSVAIRRRARAGSLRARLRGIVRRASGVRDNIGPQRNHNDKDGDYDGDDVNDDGDGSWHRNIGDDGDDATGDINFRRAEWADGSSSKLPRAPMSILSLSRRACTAGKQALRSALNASRRYYFVEGHPHGVSDHKDDRKVTMG